MLHIHKNLVTWEEKYRISTLLSYGMILKFLIFMSKILLWFRKFG